ncbi:RabGAP/TBC, partial [Neoconidiobolus thromboides FSU 785]
EVSKWMDIYEKQYLEYERLKRELIVIPQAKYSGKTKSYNPLAPEKDNPWTQYFNDQELRKLILLDVSRTFPEKDFFREDKIHEIMTEILFLYCKQKSKLSYRQGMHELLAPILYVVSMDSIHTNHSTNDKDDLKLLDSSYLPSQSYFLFIKLMSGAASFYELPEPDEANRLARAHKARNLLNQKKNERIKLLNYPPVTNNPILKTCYRAYYDILKETNPVLYQHFEKLEIEPQLFGLRWFRLLFSREFTFDETLLLWDSIFEYSKIIDDKLDLSYVTFVAAVMLFYIHDEVIDQDYSITLHKLMRFPKVKDIKIIIELAKVLSNNIDSANGYKVLKRIYEF